MASKRDSTTIRLFTETPPKMNRGFFVTHGPNPNLRQFAEKGATDTVPLQPKDLPPSQTVKKTGSLYDVHSYWSKKPYLAIERFINHYTRPHELIIDPFCGCGSTLQAAMGLDRKAIGLDLSPSATHISANTIAFVDSRTLEAEATTLVATLADLAASLYAIDLDGKRYIVSNLIHAEQVRCLKCFRFFSILQPHSSKPRSACPLCNESFSTRSRQTEFGPDEIVAVELRGSLSAKRGMLVWLSDEPRIAAQLAAQNAPKLAATIRAQRSRPVPQRLIDFGGRLKTSGSTTIGKLFDDRSLCVLDSLNHGILDVKDDQIRGKLLLAFTAVLKNSSKMYRFHEGGGGSPIGAYYVPPIRKELNPLFAFQEKISAISNSLKEIAEWPSLEFCVSTQSSCEVDIPPNSVDYIFTDPPYADTMPFGALNFIWDAWLDTSWDWESQEAIGENWKPKLTQVFREMYRIAKPGAYCSVCYHDTSEGTWQDLIDLMAEAGFQAVVGKDVLFIETTQQAYQQTVADKVVKRDHVVNFRKPVPGESVAEISISGDEDKSTFSDKVRHIVKDYLGDHPGATRDRIYDELVSHMVRAGHIEAHNFNELLLSVAVEGVPPSAGKAASRWYLQETEFDVADSAESAKEDCAAEQLAIFMRGYLKKHPDEQGVHYSNLFEYYLYSVKDKARRQLAEFLPEYFYQTDIGTWRPPSSDEETRAKAESRGKGTGRRVKRYIAQLEQGVTIPDKEIPSSGTLAEWVRHCKRAGLFEQGKLLYEKGGLDLDALPESTAAAVEEDYQTCVRMLSRMQT